mmetsp:Transcript_49113/g.147871  ORF Transcript_49113/g.147871 Transcript_49113/m.147871 type:complete len:329 (-) Transcript_49113:66-1052(-)
MIPAVDAVEAPLPRALVINLPRHPHRLRHARAELSKAGIKLNLMEAVDGTAMSQSERANNVTKLGQWFLTPGMVGCFLSHRRCWEECVASGKPLLIFEDDVVLAADFQRRAQAVLKVLPTDSWDAILLGALGCVHPRGRFGVNWAPALVGGKWRRPRRVADIDHQVHDENETIPPGIFVPLCPYGMHAYCISPRGAAKLLKRCPLASFHVDVVAWGYKDLDLFVCHPLLAWQTHNDTTIGGLHSRWQGLNLPLFTVDPYTGIEFGWSWSAPLLCLGGPQGFLLTNGRAISLMLTGFLASALLQSRKVLFVTIAYVATIVIIVRMLASQ